MCRESKKEIINRLYNVLPIGTLQMQEFLKLFKIVITEDDKEVPTACITCDLRPIMILNQHFVDEYCKTDEHLYMLIMHELYHKILGHTTLFKRTNVIDNIVFDAVINAILSRENPGEEYVSFFKNTNPSDKFPGCLLRPEAPDTPNEAKELLKVLYESDTGTYYEVYDLLRQKIKNINIDNMYVLLGNHNYDEKDDNKEMKELIERIIEKWPRPPEAIIGRDMGRELEKKKVEMKRISKMKKEFKKFLLEAGIKNGLNNDRRITADNVKQDVESFVPNFTDRRYVAKSELLDSVYLFNKETDNIGKRKDINVKTYIYLDVSGSVYFDLKNMMPLLLKPYKNKEIKMFTFSTIVSNTTYKDFNEGKINTTGGTDIKCVFEHLYSINKRKRPNKILILTDGYVGAINKSLRDRIKNEKTKIYVGLFANSTENDLKDISKKIVKVG